MTDNTYSIRGDVHYEPLTELALKRYHLRLDQNNPRIEQLDPSQIKDLDFLIELMDFYAAPDASQLGRFEMYSVEVILDYLRKTHAFYKDHLLPKIEMSIYSMTTLFPDAYSAKFLQYFYRSYQNELLEHIELEERKLFPYAEELMEGNQSDMYSVRQFRLQHDHDIVDRLDDIICEIDASKDEIARSFVYRTFKHLVEQFRNDLHVHHLIEEKVLLVRLQEFEELI